MQYLGLITRCKNEYYVKEFVDYYLSQGVDKIYIIDDDSDDKSIYDGIKNEKVTILYEKNIMNTGFASTVYKKIRHAFEWLIFVDVDEFITTKKNLHNTIRDELMTTFKDVDCVKIPWVMMTMNGREKNPKSVLLENTYRWNHDKTHPNKYANMYHRPKFACRHRDIDCKCIFRPQKFEQGIGFLNDHHPEEPKDYNENKDNYILVDSIEKERYEFGIIGNPISGKKHWLYRKLREKHITNGILLCYHYRLISIENCNNKMKTNLWYNGKGRTEWEQKNSNVTLEEMVASDCAEIDDNTIKNKVLKYRHLI